MLSHLKPKEFKVLSLTTIATPHRGWWPPSRPTLADSLGSAVADYIFEQIGGRYTLPAIMDKDSFSR